MPADQQVAEPAAATPGFRPGAWLLAGAVAVLAAGLSLGLIAMTGATPAPESPSPPAQTQPSPTPTSSGRPAAPPTTDALPGGLTPTAAEDVLSSFLDRLAQTAANPAGGMGGLSGLATGAILEELQNEQLELLDNGWSRSGTESVVSLEVTAAEPDATPPTAIVEACIDSKDVVVLDAAGKPIVSGMTPQQKRSLNVYTLVLESGNWRVADRTFPDDAAC